MKEVAPYGNWTSPVSAAAVAAAGISLEAIFLDQGRLAWTERRPAEGGRTVMVSYAAAGEFVDLVPTDFNSRSRVHEYGGRCQLLHAGVVYSSSFTDNRLYRIDPDGAASALTPANQGFRYADLELDERRGSLFAVREAHSDAAEAVNTLVRIALDHVNGGEIIAAGHDFYAAPRLSPDGRQLAWLSWNHPNMPFDGTQLWLADIDEGGDLGQPTLISGGPDESVAQPMWSPDGHLYFISDRSGWWNLYRWEAGTARNIYPTEAEFTPPPWVFGLRSYLFVSAAEILCTYFERDRWQLGRLDLATGTMTLIEQPYTALADLHYGGGQLYFLGGSPTEAVGIIKLDLATERTTVAVERSPQTLAHADISVAEFIEFPTENGLTAFAFFYPPQNSGFAGPAGTAPPLIVMSHGGPTSATSSTFSLSRQYWTSRGFAVVDVNYGGSTGYGRAYRERLRGQWGIVDVADCINAAKFLVVRGRVDGTKVAIRGGSAGGFTTMAALTFHDFFGAGCSLFGVSDLEALALETHKFESRYLDSLVGAYPAEQAIYHARSPIRHLQQLETPMLFLQGLEDKVVPPNQSERMFIALRNKEIATAYVAYEGEGHGFRQAKNIIHALESELYFYGQIFGLEPAGDLHEITIENLS